MTLQTQFEKFNKNIRMDYSVNQELASKRDILLNKLRKNDDLPSFKELNQGSYAMKTGVKPLENKDYDIDVGLRFNVNKDDNKPLELKEKICDILEEHTEYGAVIKQPCVTVTYKKDGDIAYHVDLVVYSYEDKTNTNSQLYLARGKKNSNEENKRWEEADPIGLINEIMNKFSDKDKEQYKRVIRYLKRWKNKNFSSDGNNEPPGIGITLLAYEKFQPKYTITDLVTLSKTYDDLDALIYLTNQIKNMFSYEEFDSKNNRELYRIKLELPVTPRTDVFCKMTNIQMTNFKEKIEKLEKSLKEVKEEIEIVEQCKKLQDIFGDDFEVPEKSETAKQQNRMFISSSASGGNIN